MSELIFAVLLPLVPNIRVIRTDSNITDIFFNSNYYNKQINQEDETLRNIKIY